MFGGLLVSGKTKLICTQDNRDMDEFKSEEFQKYLQEALILVLIDKKVIDKYQLDGCLLELKKYHKEVVI